MEIFLTQYITSTWGILVNTPILIAFGIAAYDAYAKRWSAKSGRYTTKGRITWSGIMPGAKPPVLISYSYTVRGALYTGVLHVSPFRIKKTIEENPKGKEVTIYYSNKDPEFSQAFKPPNHFQIVGTSVLQYLLLPLVLVNIFSIYFYWLVNVSK